MLGGTQLADANDVRVGTQARIERIPPGERRIWPQAHLRAVGRTDLDRLTDLDDLARIGFLERRVDRLERVCLAGTGRAGNDENAAFLLVGRLEIGDLPRQEADHVDVAYRF